MSRRAANTVDAVRPIPRFALRPQEAADSIGVSLSKFLQLVEEGRMPKCTKVDGVALYDTQAIKLCWEALRDGSATNAAKNPWDE